MIPLLRKCAGTIVDRFSVLAGIGHVKHRNGLISNGTKLPCLTNTTFYCPTALYPSRLFGSHLTETCQLQVINPYCGLTPSYSYFRLLNQRPLAILQPYSKFHTSTAVDFQKNPSKGDKDDKDQYQTNSRSQVRLMVIRFFSAVVAYFLLTHRKSYSSKLLGTKELPEDLQEKDLSSDEDEAQQRVKDAIKGIQLEEIVKMANGLVEKNQYIQALRLYSIVTTSMEEKNFSPKERIGFLADLISLIGIAARCLLQSDPTARQTAINLGLRHMAMLLDDLHSVKGPDELFKDVMEAGSVHDIVCLTIDVSSNYDSAIELCEKGFALLEKHRGDKVSDYFYGLLLNDMGAVKVLLKEFSDAEQFFLKALNLCERVSNVKDQTIQEQIAMIKENLADVQKELSNK